jgi:hypothetical protein
MAKWVHSERRETTGCFWFCHFGLSLFRGKKSLMGLGISSPRRHIDPAPTDIGPILLGPDLCASPFWMNPTWQWQGAPTLHDHRFLEFVLSHNRRRKKKNIVILPCRWDPLDGPSWAGVNAINCPCVTDQRVTTNQLNWPGIRWSHPPLGSIRCGPRVPIHQPGGGH